MEILAAVVVRMIGEVEARQELRGMLLNHGLPAEQPCEK